MACVNLNDRMDFCTEPKDARRHITRILCGELGETRRQKQAPNRISCFEEIDNTFDRLFVNRGASTNLGQCTKIRNPKCSKCQSNKVKPKVIR